MYYKALQNLFEHYEDFITLSEGLKDELYQRVKPKSFKKGELILDANSNCKDSYFITSGILRAYFLKDDKEVSAFFCSSNQWMNSPKSFAQQTSDIYYIDAVEDSKVLSLSINDMLFLFDSFPEMERYARLSSGYIISHLLSRMTAMRYVSPKEKYEHFIKANPNIYHRIPQKMIASYLGIRPETLSRVRAVMQNRFMLRTKSDY